MKIEELINKHYDKLNYNDKYIWNYIQKNKKKCCNLTINELAEKCNVSRTTILRFAQKLSLKGYSELKVYLQWDVDQDDKIKCNCIDIVSNDFIKCINDLREKDFSPVCKVMKDAKRVFIYGTGAVQNAVAYEIKRIFLSAGEYFHVIEGVEEREMLLNMITPEDIIIIISLKGESNKIIDFAKKLNILNIPIISITRLKNNELARLSNQNLYITTSRINIGTDIPYEATTSFFVLIEILFLNYIKYKNSID
ncbi:MurR/RpiR family transcriptional regulator [Clostridium sp. AL.422]|uniref:MurR/RpiR family transcriptional regulator n=1 Tax=Clostridium TaxID=1485 RepID=UPI00293DF32D|nr:MULTISPECIES: MurR/RpiR family transcriptional regulator [unclassified Clostridium]MDV4150439.1 MurR/RpiR family transcriptional regulator [Clostridium sp. AL.422]